MLAWGAVILFALFALLVAWPSTVYSRTKREWEHAAELVGRDAPSPEQMRVLEDRKRWSWRILGSGVVCVAGLLLTVIALAAQVAYSFADHVPVAVNLFYWGCLAVSLAGLVGVVASAVRLAHVSRRPGQTA